MSVRYYLLSHTLAMYTTEKNWSLSSLHLCIVKSIHFEFAYLNESPRDKVLLNFHLCVIDGPILSYAKLPHQGNVLSTKLMTLLYNSGESA